MRQPYEDFWNKSENINKNFMRGVDPHKHPMLQKILEKTKQAGDNVLDIGCATCISYTLFKENNIKYIGVDFSHRLLKYRLNYNNATVIHGDARQLPFKNNSFTTVFAKDVLVHQPPNDYQKVIPEMIRVTRKQAILALCKPPSNIPKNIYNLRTDEGYPVYYTQYSKTELNNYINTISNIKQTIHENIDLEGTNEPDKRHMITMIKNDQ